MIHRCRKQRESRRKRRTHEAIRGHGGGGDRTVGDDEVGEDAGEDEVDACAEGDGGDDGDDPVDVRIGRES